MIVTYNCAGYIRGCLESLRRSASDWDVIAVDNGSRDDTAKIISDEFPSVKLVATGANLGFSAGNNTGAALSTARWLFFLNPDTLVDSGALDKMSTAAKQHGALVIAPRLNGTDGRYQPGSADDHLPTFLSLALNCLLPPMIRPTRLSRRGTGPGRFDPMRAQPIERPMAAALLIRRDVYEAVGGFDERFRPIWFEDVDLCKRLLEQGHQIWYEPAAVITHVGQHTLTMYNLTSVMTMWHANLIRYARKHFPVWQASTLRWVAVVGILFRGVIRAMDPRFVRVAPGHFRLAWSMARHSDESRWHG